MKTIWKENYGAIREQESFDSNKSEGSPMIKAMKQYLLYLAGSISGRTYAGATQWRERIKYALESEEGCNVKCIDPMRGKSYLSEEQAIINESYPSTMTSGAKAVFLRDRFDVMRSDIILINIMREEDLRSIGTIAEQAWGKIEQKMVIIISNGYPILHPFWTEDAIIVSSEDDAIEFIKWLLS